MVGLLWLWLIRLILGWLLRVMIFFICCSNCLLWIFEVFNWLILVM